MEAIEECSPVSAMPYHDLWATVWPGRGDVSLGTVVVDLCYDDGGGVLGLLTILD